jgi:hypothetical protein
MVNARHWLQSHMNKKGRGISGTSGNDSGDRKTIMTRNYDVRCRPVAAADGPDFQFYRDRYGPIIARCTHCRIGLTVTDDNAGAVKWARALLSGDFIVTPDLGSPSHLKYFYDRPK